MRTLVLSSGGKDSSLATWWATCRGWSVEALVTVDISGDDSWMFQIEGTSVAKLQARAQELESIEIEVSGNKETEIDELERALHRIINDDFRKRQISIDAIVCGALASEYQRRRIEMMSERLGLISFTPLWHNGPREHMAELIECGFEIMIVSVSCEGLSEEWLGRVIDEQLFSRLDSISSEYRFSIDGEGGEYETIIVAGPHMKNRIEISGHPVWKGNRGVFKIDSAVLV